MIRIQFREPDDRLWKKWRRECQKLIDAMVPPDAHNKPPEIDDIYRRKSIKERYYFARDGQFGGKCVYCETFVTDFQRPDIDHFRPKLGATDENDQPVLVDYGNGPEPHRGYYWRAYSVENLLPACQICNQPTSIKGDKIGKHSRFPVEGNYALREADVANERPLLINPLQEDPGDHLEIDVATGALRPRNGSPRGAAAIRIFGLNERPQLVQRRQKLIDAIRAQLVKVVTGHPEAVAILKELNASKDGVGEYTSVVRAVLAEQAANFRRFGG